MAAAAAAWAAAWRRLSKRSGSGGHAPSCVSDIHRSVWDYPKGTHASLQAEWFSSGDCRQSGGLARIPTTSGETGPPPWGQQARAGGPAAPPRRRRRRRFRWCRLAHAPKPPCPPSLSMETSGCYQETVDTDTFHPSDPPEYEQAEPANPGQVLPLPAPSEGASGRQHLELGERAQMDHLGPLVIGEDGSVGRIANCEWAAQDIGCYACKCGQARAVPCRAVRLGVSHDSQTRRQPRAFTRAVATELCLMQTCLLCVLCRDQADGTRAGGAAACLVPMPRARLECRAPPGCVQFCAMCA